MTTKVAVVGAGTCGRLHAEAWSSLPRVEVVKVTDVDRAAGLGLAKRHGAAFAPSFEEALEGADVVSVCTPSELHAGQVVLAARAGADVLVEKPAATTPEGYAHIEEAVRTTGIRVVPAAAGRFYPEVRRAKAWLDEGRIGEPKWLIETCRLDSSWLPGWYFDRTRSGGGVLLSAGTNSVDRLLWLMDARSVEVISAETRCHPASRGAEDFAKAYLYLDEKLPASMEFDWAAHGREGRRVDVFGSAGTLRITVSGGVVADTRVGSEGWFPYPKGATHTQKAVVALKGLAEALLDSRRSEATPSSTLADDHRAFEAIRLMYQAAGWPQVDGKADREAGD